jgi:hypothetical protein
VGRRFPAGNLKDLTVFVVDVTTADLLLLEPVVAS